MQPPVILVPGIGDDERKLRMLVRRLQQAGRQPIAISPQPSDGSAPIDTLARLLADAISDALGPDQPLDLFGFSMGGLICRYYLQQLGGLWRTRRFVTLASPHRGTWVAYRYPGRAAARQMRPYSPFLVALNAEMHLEQVAFTFLWSPLDLTVLPASNSALPVGRSVRVLSPMHGTLLYDPNVLRQVAACLDDDVDGEAKTAA